MRHSGEPALRLTRLCGPCSAALAQTGVPPGLPPHSRGLLWATPTA
jgi:hypothetical protein